MRCKGLKVYVENIDCYMLASLEGCLQKWIDEHQECEIVDFREIKDRLIIFYKIGVMERYTFADNMMR